mgnify:CR=1 FL=1
MNRRDAKIIAEKITNEQLSTMFKNAKENVKEWAKVSIVNKGMTKGVAWNILASDFNITQTYHILAKTNMVREFGEFLPKDLQLHKKEKKKITKTPTHQDPKFK